MVKYYSVWPDSILCLSQCLVSRNVDVLKLSKGETLNEELRVTSLSASINRWPWWDVVSLKSFKDLFQSIFEFRFSNPSQSPTPAFSSVFFAQTNQLGIHKKSTWHGTNPFSDSMISAVLCSLLNTEPTWGLPSLPLGGFSHPPRNIDVTRDRGAHNLGVNPLRKLMNVIFQPSIFKGYLWYLFVFKGVPSEN